MNGLEKNIENCFEFLKGSNRATLSITESRYKTRVIKLKERYPDDVDYVINKDGSMCAHVPAKWLKINPIKVLSESDKEMLTERLKNGF